MRSSAIHLVKYGFHPFGLKAWELLGNSTLAGSRSLSAIHSVGLTRLERVTFPLSEGCSNQLSYRPLILADGG